MNSGFTLSINFLLRLSICKYMLIENFTYLQKIHILRLILKNIVLNFDQYYELHLPLRNS